MVKLAAFDFDHTIINENSDIYINKILTKNDNISFKKYKYPEEVEMPECWTDRMSRVFEYMHSNFNIKSLDFIECLKEIKIDESMKSLINGLKSNGYELIIISDANTFFIETILNENGLEGLFNKIYTNPGHFDESEKLIVKKYSEIYNGKAYECETKICSANICKGSVLEAHIKALDSMTKRHIVYVGDGTNDYCPGLYLNENDSYFIRNNHSLSKLFSRNKELCDKLKTTVNYWNDAQDIIINLNL